MSYPSVDIRRGSKVFARGEEIGEVVGISPNAVDVQKGTLRKHTYRIHIAYVVEAAEGVVDLDIDLSTVVSQSMCALRSCCANSFSPAWSRSAPGPSSVSVQGRLVVTVRSVWATR